MWVRICLNSATTELTEKSHHLPRLSNVLGSTWPFVMKCYQANWAHNRCVILACCTILFFYRCFNDGISDHHKSMCGIMLKNDVQNCTSSRQRNFTTQNLSAIKFIRGYFNFWKWSLSDRFFFAFIHKLHSLHPSPTHSHTNKRTISNMLQVQMQTYAFNMKCSIVKKKTYLRTFIEHCNRNYIWILIFWLICW